MAHSLEERASRGQRIHAFLNDEAISECLTRIERRYYEEFKAADSSDKRVTAWAKANVLADFEVELKGLLDDGELATANLNLLAQKADARRTGRPLPHE